LNGILWSKGMFSSSPSRKLRIWRWERFLIPLGTSAHCWKLRGTLVPRSKVVSQRTFSRDTCHETHRGHSLCPSARSLDIGSDLIHRSGSKSQRLLPDSRWRLLLTDIGSCINARRQRGQPGSYRYWSGRWDPLSVQIHCKEPRECDFSVSIGELHDSNRPVPVY
jgi:hypothetical protein